MSGRRWTLAVVLFAAVAAAGCRPWALKGRHQLKLVAPASVPVGGEFVFHVEVAGPDGQPAERTAYEWMIDWPEVRGIPHTGISFEPQRMKVKGGPGQATIRLYVHDEAGRNSQVHRSEFKVDAAEGR